jgi:hypothetical protein
MLLTLIVGLVVIGLILWVINTMVPMDAKIKQILNVVVVLVVIIWVLQVTGLWARLAAT